MAATPEPLDFNRNEETNLTDVTVNETCTVYEVSDAVLQNFEALDALIIERCGPDYALDRMKK
jgi:hypothetical protein